jgi:hypothetical protein
VRTDETRRVYTYQKYAHKRWDPLSEFLVRFLVSYQDRPFVVKFGFLGFLYHAWSKVLKTIVFDIKLIVPLFMELTSPLPPDVHLQLAKET